MIAPTAEYRAEMLQKTAKLKARAERDIARHQAELQALDDVAPLNELATKYEQKWPEIRYVKGGSRARKAVELVMRGAVVKLEADAQGSDRWLVNAHECSKKGGWCECEDRVRTDPTYGKLCAHRLAVAMKTNWLGDQNQALLKFLQQHAESEYVDLLVERDYEWHGDGQRAVVIGHGLPGQKIAKLAHEQRIEATLPQFQWALEQIGWGLADLPTKLPGWSDYIYRLRPGPGIPVNEYTFYHKGRTWLMEERERTRRGILLDIAAHLEEHLAGPFPIRLSDYDARRVWKLRRELQQGEKQANDVWAMLPEALQAAIIENEGVQYAD